jgi:hypothetical protein
MRIISSKNAAPRRSTLQTGESRIEVLQHLLVEMGQLAVDVLDRLDVLGQ